MSPQRDMSPDNGEVVSADANLGLKNVKGKFFEF
jgi:hypothetical protein